MTAREKGFAIWLTGLPASGKTSLAAALTRLLGQRGVRVQTLDSDELREVLTPGPTYSESERDWFYRTMVFIGRLLTENGVNVFFAATAPHRRYREWARQAIDRFMEVYLLCPLETCRARDRKGIYSRDRTQGATTIPGLQVPYELPEAPELVVDTEHLTPEEGAQKVIARLEELPFLDSNADIRP
jgi:adenylylsulfate kinase